MASLLDFRYCDLCSFRYVLIAYGHSYQFIQLMHMWKPHIMLYIFPLLVGSLSFHYFSFGCAALFFIGALFSAFRHHKLFALHRRDGDATQDYRILIVLSLFSKNPISLLHIDRYGEVFASVMIYRDGGLI